MQHQSLASLLTDPTPRGRWLRRALCHELARKDLENPDAQYPSSTRPGTVEDALCDLYSLQAQTTRDALVISTGVHLQLYTTRPGSKQPGDWCALVETGRWTIIIPHKGGWDIILDGVKRGAYTKYAAWLDWLAHTICQQLQTRLKQLVRKAYSSYSRMHPRSPLAQGARKTPDVRAAHQSDTHAERHAPKNERRKHPRATQMVAEEAKMRWARLDRYHWERRTEYVEQEQPHHTSHTSDDRDVLNPNHATPAFINALGMDWWRNRDDFGYTPMSDFHYDWYEAGEFEARPEPKCHGFVDAAFCPQCQLEGHPSSLTTADGIICYSCPAHKQINCECCNTQLVTEDGLRACPYDMEGWHRAIAERHDEILTGSLISQTLNSRRDEEAITS